MSIEFWITALVVTVTPGTGALFTVAAGISRGARASVVAAIGCTLGIVPHLVAAVSGAALVFATSTTAFAVLKWAGVAYLLWMAWTALRNTGVLSVDETAPPSSLKTVTTAVAINLLNPKLTVFFFAFLPQFVPAASEHAVPHMLLLGAMFMLMTLVVFAGYGIGAAAVRDVIVTRPRAMKVLNRVFAVSFVGLGVRLAVAQQ